MAFFSPSLAHSLCALLVMTFYVRFESSNKSRKPNLDLDLDWTGLGNMASSEMS